MPIIETPCISNCTIDSVSGLCCGCGRTLDEIGRWSSLDGDARRAVMRELSGRRARAARLRAPSSPERA